MLRHPFVQHQVYLFYLVLLSVVQSSGEAGVLRFDVTVQEGKTQYFTL